MCLARKLAVQLQVPHFLWNNFKYTVHFIQLQTTQTAHGHLATLLKYWLLCPPVITLVSLTSSHYTGFIDSDLHTSLFQTISTNKVLVMYKPSKQNHLHIAVLVVCQPDNKFHINTAQHKGIYWLYYALSYIQLRHLQLSNEWRTLANWRNPNNNWGSTHFQWCRPEMMMMMY